MSDASLAPIIHNKLESLEKFVLNKNNTREMIQQEIYVLKNWLVSDISVIQHRCLWGYMTYLYNSYGDDYANLDDFVDDLLLQNGFCRITGMIESKDKKFFYRKYKPDSLSYNKCSKKKRTIILNKIIEYSKITWNCDFELWHNEWIINPELVQ